MNAADVVLYFLAMVIAAGIVFLIWTLIHLVSEARRPPAAQAVDPDPWRR